ncbi:MAG: 5-formyltetrahydrofolate cyclo-ligase [Lachnospiraceae bacterium]|nr:5-formyltetrahydrofolate cyclo-ligase [Lachnospiraceae bacterium]
MQEVKKELRRQILQARDALSETEREEASLLLTERILGHPWYDESDILLGFVSYGSEIDTKEILTGALHAGKQVYVPRIEKDGVCRKEMHFYRIESMGELQEGFKGILEPAGDTERFVYREELVPKTLMLMPGVAFDREHNRMGYGGGFYDKFLMDKEALTLRTIAVGFACQMVEWVPVGAWDVKPCQILCL